MNPRLSTDGSFTAYSAEFDECYHSTKDGAINESFVKHILPCFYFLQSCFGFELDSQKLENFQNLSIFENLDSEILQNWWVDSENSLQNSESKIRILDICFGLGLNAILSALFYSQILKNFSLEIYSPEFDQNLISSLPNFPYPRILDAQTIITKIINSHQAKIKNVTINLYISDALDFVQKMPDNFFDVVYQDAFSPAKNPALWSEQYFAQIERITKPSEIVSKYSQARVVRENAHKNGLSIYDFQSLNFPKIRGGSLFVKGKIATLKSYKIKQKIY